MQREFGSNICRLLSPCLLASIVPNRLILAPKCCHRLLSMQDQGQGQGVDMTRSELRLKAKARAFPGLEAGEDRSSWTGPFHFIQGADTQLGMIDKYLLHKADPKWEVEVALIREAVIRANKMEPKPNFFIVCGDLVDAFPGTVYRKGQEADFKKAFADLSNEIPLICVCGNHDVGDTPTPASISFYKENFGDDFFAFYTSGIMCIVLNSQYYQDSSLVPVLAQEQEIWLDERLAEAKSGLYKHVIVFQHIPWFLKDSNEEKEYFNIDVPLRHKMLDRFYESGVRYIFCGHYHRNAGGKYKDLELVVTSAVGAQLGDDKSGVRVVTVLESELKHQYYPVEEIPSHVDLK